LEDFTTGLKMTFDFAAHARSLGAKSYTVRTVEELRDAFEMARKETGSTLIKIKVLPGTNTSWIRIMVACWCI
jgi:3D-(3,5/4)-trihydroxycyclohexane-1,2-dione acylhydrolase (decyclizing)